MTFPNYLQRLPTSSFCVYSHTAAEAQSLIFFFKYIILYCVQGVSGGHTVANKRQHHCSLKASSLILFETASLYKNIHYTVYKVVYSVNNSNILKNTMKKELKRKSTWKWASFSKKTYTAPNKQRNTLETTHNTSKRKTRDIFLSTPPKKNIKANQSAKKEKVVQQGAKGRRTGTSHRKTSYSVFVGSTSRNILSSAENPTDECSFNNNNTTKTMNEQQRSTIITSSSIRTSSTHKRTTTWLSQTKGVCFLYLLHNVHSKHTHLC